MINEGKFGVQEAVSLTTMTICAKLFFTSPSWLTNYVGTAGWQMTLISNLTAIIAFTLILALLKRFPGKNIIEIFDMSLGRFFGFIFSLIFSVALLQEAGLLMREFSEVVIVYVYPDTPIEVLTGAMTIIVAVVSYLGLESLARVSKLGAYSLLIILLALYVLGAQNYNLANIFPILGYGADKTIINGLERSSSYEEIIIIAIFAGSLQGIKYIRKAGYISLILSGVILTLGLLFVELSYPIETLQEMVSPVYILARSIKYGNFFQRLDSLFLFLWIFTTIIAVSALFYCSLSTYCKTFRLQDARPAVFPMAVILYAVSFIPRDFPTLIEKDVQQLRSLGWAIFYILPVIALIVAVLRNKGGKA